MYDIFVISKQKVDDDFFQKVQNRYPIAQKIDFVTTLSDVRSKSFTKMFWIVWDDVILDNEFDVAAYRATKWDDKYVHVFLNDNNFDGLALIPKTLEISDKEFNHRFYINKKEIQIVASRPRPYNYYKISSFHEYEKLLETEHSDLFWVIWPEIEIIDTSILDFYISHHNSYDRSENHMFKNLCNDNASYLYGLLLCSKNKKISKREFDRRYLIDKKEHDIVASRFRYPKVFLSDYESYEKYLKESKSDLFWGIWPNIDIIKEEIFDLYFDPNDGKYDHDRNVNHVFLNLCNDKSSYLNGVVLFSKHSLISKREFDRRYLIDKKEHDIVASRFRYPKYQLETYEDYENILQRNTDPMFWCIWPEVEITNEEIFDLYFDPNDGKYDYDRSENHVFKHLFRKEETYANGLILFSKQKRIGKREFEHRFLIEKKEHDILCSKLKPYDIVFISYNEKEADKNFETLRSKFPRTKRIHGVKGIHQAHIEAAKICDTEMLWVVDADAIILDTFHFDHEVSTYEKDIVHVWRSKNPINDLIYGYGGVKLLPRKLTLNLDISSTDMTTSISERFKAVPEIANITAFNVDEFSTWKSAFRECVKLSSKLISRQNDQETNERLEVWKTKGSERLFGEYAILGATDGIKFAEEHINNLDALKCINDFTWLREQFKERYERI